MPKFFNLLEAEGLLPQVERLLTNIRQQKQRYEEADGGLSAISQRITLIGGMIPPRERILQFRSQKDASARALKSAIEQIQSIGCQLKDLDTGLVDFPTLYRDREVYLCWKLGEPSIGFWHHVEDGYGGRQPIDSDFLANHHGDS
jgi:hypothetical protein